MSSTPDGPRSADELLTDANFLVHSPAERVVPQLAQAIGPQSRLAAAVYRTSLSRHRAAEPGARRRLLQLDSMRWGAETLAASLAGVPVEGEPEPLLRLVSATGGVLDHRFRFEVPGAEQSRVAAIVERAGRPIAMVGGVDGIRAWDVETGEPAEYGAPASGVVTFAWADGRLLALTESTGESYEDVDPDEIEDPAELEAYFLGEATERTLRVRNVLSGEVLAEATTDPQEYIADAEVLVHDGRVIIVTATNDSPPTVHDCHGDESGTFSLPITEDGLTSVACAVVATQPLVATATDGVVRIWCGTGDAWHAKWTIAHPGWLNAVAFTRLAGRDVLVTATAVDHADGDRFAQSLYVWDPVTGEQVGEPVVTGLDELIGGLECTAIGDRTLVLAHGGTNRTAEVWDLGAGKRWGRPLASPHAPGSVAGLGEVAGTVVAVTANLHDEAQLWELSAAEVAASPDHAEPADAAEAVTGGTVASAASGRTGGSTATTGWDGFTTTLDGRAVAITGTPYDGGLRLREADGSPIGVPFAKNEHGGMINAVACATVADRPIVCVADGLEARIARWDATTGAELPPLSGRPSQTSAGFAEPFLSMATAELDGRPILVAAGQGAEVWTWDLESGRPLGEPLTGHHRWSGEAVGRPGLGTKLYVTSLVGAVLDGRPIAVTGGEDGTVRRWDLAGRRELTGGATSAHGTGSGDPASAAATPSTGTAASREPLTETEFDALPGKDIAVDAVACLSHDGRRVIAAGGRDRTVRLWDLATGRLLDGELSFPEPVTALTVTDAGLAVGFGVEVAVFA